MGLPPHLITSGAGPLTRDASVTLNAAGGGFVELGPVPSGQVWLVTRVAVSCTGANNPMPTCQVYDGPAVAPNLIDMTYTGGFDASDFPTPLVLSTAEYLTFVWANGTVNQVATARLVGFQQST